MASTIFESNDHATAAQVRDNCNDHERVMGGSMGPAFDHEVVRRGGVFAVVRRRQPSTRGLVPTGICPACGVEDLAGAGHPDPRGVHDRVCGDCA